MKAEIIQSILSRLYSDTNYLMRFVNNRQLFYFEEQIRDRSLIGFLDKLNTNQLLFFAKTLNAKRYHEIKRLLPLTAHFLGMDMAVAFREFSSKPAVYGIHQHHEEALAFLEYLRMKLRRNHLIREVMRFERQLISQFLSPPVFRLCLFRYPVIEMWHALNAGFVTSGNRGFNVVIFRRGKALLKL